MDRILQNTPGSVSQQWFEAGVAVDPGTVTVDVTRADGTVVTTGGSVSGTGTGARTWSVTTVNTALLDRLKITWNSSNKGALVSYLEIVGGFVFDLADGIAATGKTAGEVAAARVYAETELEKELGYALVPRYAKETRTGYWGHALRVRNPYVRTVRSVTANGVALTAPQLASLTFDPNGFVLGYPWAPTWVTPISNVTIGYEHGLDTPPPGAARAALDEAVAFLGGSTADGTSGIDPRAERIITVDGEVRLRASTGTLLSATAADWVTSNRLALVA